ncbi:SIR2 family protein [Caulobacter sp. DWR1-3-2b1]|uniref:SIR2 family protein n=1 Tax=Caulobacter sp. DWR1-3-2b1 TaxID=2804670 RepID=UPI003CE7B907
MDFEEAAKRVHLGRSILFTGAGFSFGATSTRDKPLTDADGVAAELSADAGEPDPLPLDLAADEYLSKVGDESKIVRLLQDTFHVKTFEEYHSDIASLPWRRIYTTNYDNLVEACIRAGGRTPSVATLSDSPSSTLANGSIVHLNGFIERLTPANWDIDTILTTGQYLGDKVRRSPWAEVFRSDINIADSIIFMGYSLYDLDISRILFENPDLIKKTFFVVGKAAKRETVIKASRFGAVVAENVSDIAPIFPKIGTRGLLEPSPFTVALSRFEITPAIGAPDTDKVVRFLTKGDVEESYISRSVIEGVADYYIPRSDIDGLVSIISKGRGRVLIHSSLGNGKTALLSEISTLLSVSGMVCYSFNGSTEGVENDFEYLASLDTNERSKVVLMIEDGFSFSNLVKSISTNFPDVSIITTARSAAVETRLGSVVEAFGEDYAKFDLNDLSEDEAKELDQLLLKHGLWGDKQGWKDDKRLRFIEKQCRGHLGTVLLSVCRSTQIFAKLKVLLSGVDDVGGHTFEGLLAALTLAYAGHTARVSQICEIVQADLFKTSKAQGSEILREFLSFDNNRVSVRSSVFAQAVLTDLISDHKIVSELPVMLSRLDALSVHNDFYKLPAQKLMRFSFIERIISDPDKGQKLVRYYENIRATGVGVQNPQFWLQYAIARLSFKDYVGAEAHFDAAFGLVDRRRSYDPFQIENHYARFLLESRAETTHWSDYYEAALKAHTIIKSQMRRYEEGHYPYKVAANYLPYVAARANEFSTEQLEEFGSWCDELLQIAAAAPVDVRKTGYWREFNKVMADTKDFVSEAKYR